MKTFFKLAMMAVMALPTATMAQALDDDDDDWGDTPTYPSINTGFFRLVNNGYGDVLNLTGTHTLSLDATENEASTMPGTIFYYDTNGIYSFADDMAQLGENINYLELMQLMARSAWKSGDYTTYDLSSQGVSLVGYLHRLKEFVDAAVANFPESEEVKDFYENGPVWYLSVAMTGAFYPADMESLDTFKAAVARWLKQWKNYFDINLYLKPATNIENSFLLHFHTPIDISKVEDTQEQINNMTSEETGSLGYHYDFFGCFKRKVAEEAAKELDADGVAFINEVLAQLQFDRECYIGENEQGKLYVVGLSKEAQFGENGELASVNQDELIWTMQPVNATNPLLVEMNRNCLGVDGYYYTTFYTDFAYQLGQGVEACYISNIAGGDAVLTPIEDKVPANTAVVLRSKNPAAVANVLLPVDEELPAIEGNLLKGTCLPLDNAEGKCVLTVQATTNGDAATIVMVSGATEVAANSCYTETPCNLIGADLTGISSVVVAAKAATTAMFDLQGRRVVAPTKGIYVINGKKVVK